MKKQTFSHYMIETKKGETFVIRAETGYTLGAIIEGPVILNGCAMRKTVKGRLIDTVAQGVE